MAEDTLQASVEAGPSGPVITLSGEADLTTVAGVSALICGQLAAGTVELTIDVSGLRFADTASIRALLGADQMLTIREGTPGEPSEAST